MNIPSLNSNWVDLVVLVVIMYFVLEAFNVGFFIMLSDFLSFLFAIGSAFVAYPFVASLIKANFSISSSFSNLFSFLLVAVLTGGLSGYLFSKVLKKIPSKLWKSKLNFIAAIIPATLEALVIIAAVLTLIVSLPVSPKIKKDVSKAKIAGYIVKNTSGISAKLNDIFGKAIEDSLAYLTVTPGSREVVQLTTGERNLSVDPETELAMFELVNIERQKRGVRTLGWSPEIVEVSREYARDMWERQYFGHYSPEGENVGDRLEKAGISYQVAGENLAMAPTLEIAHSGLMNSEGHRKNILEASFGKIGIGVIDNGVYGKIFVQVFTD